ncbi:MAG: 4-alpha-glucanotransferase, partial [Bacteroidaceae bacterium]|nr:4-alpha-glucanotransferase [Bacteroidaceae bacterium]
MKKIEFIVTFHTDDNATIQVKYRFRTTKGEEFENRLQLEEGANDTWSGFLTFDDSTTELIYGYEVTRNCTTVRSEWGETPHSINLEASSASWKLFDKWYDAPFCNYMQSGLFKKFYNRETAAFSKEKIAFPNNNSDILFIDIQACGLTADETLVLTGDDAEVGNWEPTRGIRMTNVNFNRWQCAVEASALHNKTLSFKFVALNTKSGEARWEAGDNRTIFIANEERATINRFTFEGIDFGTPRLRVAGTVIPLFSLRSESSWGIGDFGDLKKMAEWLSATGQHVLQLLPVNDTTIYGGEGDSYPYNCVSVFALHPQYVDISALPAIKDGRTRAAFFRRAKRLNENRTFDYQAVNELKENYLRKLYEESGEKLLESPEFKLFEKEQKAWLEPYCAYRFLSKNICPGPGNWGKYNTYETDTCERLIKEYSNAESEMRYYALVQFFLYKQLKEAHEYSLSLGVTIKGDIPIGVAPDGVDVWCDRKLFNCKGSAGAPPDAFSADGQNWGFPTYNWETMALDGY